MPGIEEISCGDARSDVNRTEMKRRGGSKTRNETAKQGKVWKRYGCAWCGKDALGTA